VEFLPLITLAIRYAPTLIGLIAGDPAGKVASQVVDTVRRVTGSDNAKEAQAKLEADPALQAVLVSQLQADTERFRIEAEDRANARSFGLGLVQQKHWTSNMPAATVIMVMVAHFLITGAIFLIPGDISDRMFQLVTAAYGTSSTAFGIAIAYYLGSSRSSATKDDQIGQALNAAVAGNSVRR
jgi:hypothetical protein